jgi:hypothetical protein
MEFSYQRRTDFAHPPSGPVAGSPYFQQHRAGKPVYQVTIFPGIRRASQIETVPYQRSKALHMPQSQIASKGTHMPEYMGEGESIQVNG